MFGLKSSSITQRALVLALLCAPAAVSAGWFFELGPAKAIYPPQQIPLNFPHDFHTREADEAKGIQGQGLDCDFCHENISESKLSSDRDIPGHDVCENCHGDWIGEEDEPAAAGDCARCHDNMTKAAKKKTKTASAALSMVLPAPHIKFAHEKHIEAGHKCVECHSNVPKKRLATRDDLPTMDRCIDCHQKKKVSVECQTCHLTNKQGKVITKFPEGELKPQRYHSFALHDADFLRDHAVPAMKDKAFCESCHTTNECLACHDGIARDQRYHPAAWLAQHSIRAKKDDFRCQSCHQLQNFCRNCHVRSGVAIAGTLPNPRQRLTVRRSDPSQASSPAVGPHPMAANGWLNPQSRNFHGFHAQRNIRACASCHQEQYCATCHASSFGNRGGSGVNPHGPNPQRLKGSLAAKQNARACLKCHSAFDSRWR